MSKLNELRLVDVVEKELMWVVWFEYIVVDIFVVVGWIVGVFWFIFVSVCGT